MKDLNQIVVENNEFIIFAAQPHEPHVVMNALSNAGVLFQVLLGSYKGELETSFIIPADKLSAVQEAGFLDEQESILILGAAGTDGNRPARLKFLHTAPFGAEVQELGKLVRVTKEEAYSQEGWTFNPMINSFFTIKPAENQ